MFKTEFPSDAVNAFLRSWTADFTPKILQRQLAQKSIRLALREIPDYLDKHPWAFRKDGDLYISRAGLFTNKWFSMRPSKTELALGVLLIGHRCMPFVEPETLPSELKFFAAETRVRQKVCVLSADEVLSAHSLFGEEYIAQYIALDPANHEVDFVKNEYELPSQINVTAADMQVWYKKWNFTCGDRILARVVNWDRGYIELQPLKKKSKTPFEITIDDERRSQWYVNLEKLLNIVIDDYGPCGSIEEQLSYTFFENIDALCIPQCGSIEEYLEQSKGISIEEYGVESRLWKKGEEIPAIGIWSNSFDEVMDLTNTLYSKIGISIPDFIFDAYLLDSLYRKEIGFSAVAERIVPDILRLNKDQLKDFLLHIETRYAMLAKQYNRFEDFEKGDLRKDMLALYTSLVRLIYELDICRIPADLFPQQALVTLSQLFAHTNRIAEAILHQDEMTDKDLSAITISLEGMTLTFDDIEEELMDVMRSRQKHNFTVIKKE